jgi:hypothetical protein
LASRHEIDVQFDDTVEILKFQILSLVNVEPDKVLIDGMNLPVRSSSWLLFPLSVPTAISNDDYTISKSRT